MIAFLMTGSPFWLLPMGKWLIRAQPYRQCWRVCALHHPSPLLRSDCPMLSSSCIGGWKWGASDSHGLVAIDVSLVMFVDCFEIVLPLCLWALGRIACFRSGLWWLRIDVSFLLFISTSRRNQHLAVSLSVEPNGLLQGVWWLIACGLFVSDESSCFNIYLPMVPRLSPYLSIVRNLGSMFLQTLCQSSDHHAGFFGWAS
jgi:hypothetical protein